MKNLKTKMLLMKNGVILTAALIAAIAAVLDYAFRVSHVYIDTATFSGLSMLLLWIAILNALALTAMYVIKTNNISIGGSKISERKGFSVAYFICLGITVFFVIYDIVNAIISGSETIPVAMRFLKADIPYILAVFAIVLLALVFPQIKNKRTQRIISGIAVGGVLISGFLTLYPCYPYKITCDPMVIDNGTEYAVVFATNDKGTGYVQYEYEGENYTVYDQNGGRKNGDSKIHTITVPKEHLNSNRYRVGSKRVIDELSYGGRSGKEVVSDYYEFNAPSGSEQKYLTVSDWHTYLDKVYDAAKYAGDYNGIILLGDPAPGLMFEDEIKEYIVEFGGELSKGVMPIIYVRGNHETRGKEAANLPDYLGLDSFYYTTEYGNYSFLVLDSGEDKEDSHPEYGGMVDYGQYRKSMVEWMKTLPETDKKTIALVHSYEICIEEDLSSSAYSELSRLNVKQIISGHTHTCEFLENNGMNVYIDGGHSGGTFIISKLTLNEQGYILEAWNDSGEQVFKENLSW